MSSEAARVAPVLGPVISAGLAVLAAAAWTLVTVSPSPGQLAGIAALVLAATLAEAFPVPIELEGLAAGGVSLAAIFIVGAAVVYGWAPAVVVALLALTLVQLSERRALERFLYNAAVYAISGFAAGVAAYLARTTDGVGGLVLAVVLASAAFYASNVVLIAAVVARAAAAPLLGLLGRSVVSTAIPFSIMASVSLTLTVLWEASPLLSAALIGPLVAVALYQRSVHEALAAMRLALTDPLTGLGNHRHFHERLQRDLDRAQRRGTALSVCLIDLDDFKQVNDRYGHPVGDRVLAQVASRLRHGGEAFRLGGDEFALLLPGRDQQDALAIAQLVLERVAGSDCEPGSRITVSAGIATYPDHGLDRSDLVRVADSALYCSKESGKGRVRIYQADVVEIAEIRRLAEERDRRAGVVGAAGLAQSISPARPASTQPS